MLAALQNYLLDIDPADETIETEPLGVSLRRLLETARNHLDMDVAFVSQFSEGHRKFVEIVSKSDDCPIAIDGSDPLEESYCQRIVDGRLPEIIKDATKLDEAAALPVTAALPIGGHIGVPLRLSDGKIYGTFCCFSARPRSSLNRRDLAVLRMLADLAAGQIEDRLGAQAHRKGISVAIERIIDRNNLTIFYQPIHSMSDREIVGFEALARFPDSELRKPSDWFADANEVGLGVELELAALRTALRALPSFPSHQYIAVNLSPETIASGLIQQELEGIAASRVVLEITEHAVIEDYDLLKQALVPLRYESRIAVDDVGAGYSGLSRILDIEPDILKLDIALTRGIDSSPARAALGTALVAFAANIQCSLVAEGVETPEEFETLKRLGVQCAQGFLLGQPMPIVRAIQHSRSMFDNSLS